jgi:hypothetical protein
MPQSHDYIADLEHRIYEERLKRGLGELILMDGRTYKDLMATAEGRLSAWSVLRRFDDVRSTEAAAILTFAGIMLAADLVLLSADPSSCIAVVGAVSKIAFWAAVLLGVSAIFGLLSFAVRFRAGDNAHHYVRLLGAYLFYIDYKRKMNLFAKFMSISGVVVFLGVLSLKLLQWSC